MGSENVVDVPVPPFTEQMQIEVGDLRGELIGIDDDMPVSFLVHPVQAIGRVDGAGGSGPLKQIGIGDPLQDRTIFTDAHRNRIHQIGAHRLLFSLDVVTEDGEWIVVACFDSFSGVVHDRIPPQEGDKINTDWGKDSTTDLLHE